MNQEQIDKANKYLKFSSMVHQKKMDLVKQGIEEKESGQQAFLRAVAIMYPDSFLNNSD